MLKEIEKAKDLKHVETVDKSGPMIDENSKIQGNGHKALMAAIAKE
jgi:hypothetical protein